MPSQGRFKQNAPGSKPRKKRVVKTAVGPQGLPTQASSTQKAAPRKVVTRPAPAVQPGPVRATERKVIRKAEKKAATEKRASATRTGMSDADRARADAYKQTDKYLKTLRLAQAAGYTGSRRRTGILGLGGKQSRADASLNAMLSPVKRTAKSGPDRPRTDAELRRFLATGEKPVRISAEERVKLSKAEARAPVIKVLNETMRTSRAVSGAAEKVVKGKPLEIPDAVKKGLVDNKGPGFQKILRDAGAPRGVAAPLGFALDVGTDPLTYTTFGANTLSKQAATRASTKAAKAGMSKAGQETVARAAARNASEGKGLVVRFAGREVPAATKATAKTAKAASKVTPKVVKKAGGKVKDVARDVRPQLAPAGVDEATHVAARQASRRARATRTQGVAQAEREARDLAKRIGEANYAKVIDAIETGKIGKLSPELRQAAVDIRSKLRYAQRVRKRSGLAQGSIRNYFPHALEDPLLKGLGVIKDDAAKPMEAGTRVVPKPGSAKTRVDRRPIAAQNVDRKAAGKEPFSTDAPLVYLNYMDETAKVASTGQLAKDLADTGRTAKPGAALKDGEQVYHLGVKDGRLGLREVKLDQVGKAKGGRYVILDKRVVDRAEQSAKPAQAESTIGKGFDKATRGFKTLATLSPGFHARNAIGDTQMAYLAQPARKLPGNLKKSGGALRVASKQEREPFERALSGKTIKVGGKTIPTEKFVELARREGVIRSGFVGRELEDLSSATVSGKRAVKKGKVRAAGRRVNRWMQNREDLQRLATFKDALDRGMKPGEAADRAMNFHIDYGDLTNFERTVGRRAAPFYTFSARAIPMHAKAFVQTPGKFASIEKARQNVAQAAGMDEDWQGGLQEFQQRQAPFGTGKHVISAALPITVLNELPTSFNPSEYLKELGQYGVQMSTPLAKIPIELLAGRNMFLRKDIEPKEAPLVSAPVWVRLLPADAKKAWGVTEDFRDPRTGNKQLGWYGTPDYIARSLPGVVGFVNTMLTEGKNRRGMNPEQRAASFTVGVRSEPYDPVTAAMGALFDRKDELEKKVNSLRQQKVTAEDKRMREASASLKLLDYQIKSLSVKRGDEIPISKDAKKPAKNAARIAELQARQKRLSEPLREKAKKGQVVYETEELKKVRDELKRLKGPQPKQSRVLKLPETPEEQVRRELDEFKARQKPGAIEDEIRREIERFKAEQAARAGR